MLFNVAEAAEQPAEDWKPKVGDVVTYNGKKHELANISVATNEAVGAAQLTVLELQQTVVKGWKAASADGKLSEDEIKQLGVMLVQKTMEKMSNSAKNVLTSAGVDITALIKGAGEALINRLKN